MQKLSVRHVSNPLPTQTTSDNRPLANALEGAIKAPLTSIQGAVEKYLQGFDGWDAESGVHWKVVKDLPQGSLCIDAGANIGIVAVTLAALRPDLRIIAIEPVPDNCNSPRRNVQANELENVEVIQAALETASAPSA